MWTRCEAQVSNPSRRSCAGSRVLNIQNFFFILFFMVELDSVNLCQWRHPAQWGTISYHSANLFNGCNSLFKVCIGIKCHLWTERWVAAKQKLPCLLSQWRLRRTASWKCTAKSALKKSRGFNPLALSLQYVKATPEPRVSSQTLWLKSTQYLLNWK